MKKLKVGDTVKIISGKDKGKVGDIKTIYHKTNQLLIEGINSKIKHIKPQQKNEAGRIITMDVPLDISNVMFCYDNENISRIGFTMDESKSKYQRISRVLKKTGKTIS